MNNILKYKKIARYFLFTVFFLFLLFYLGFELPFRGFPSNKKRHGNPPLTPAWALECWLWEDDSNTAGRVDTLLEGYAKFDIPVRTILLDSPWSLRYNDFEVDTLLYPQPEKWFRKLQDNGYRVVLWMTSMVNSQSKDTRIRDDNNWFADAAGKGYVAGNGDQIKWWKGKGGHIDYTSPAALNWWHGMQQKVFDYGIDGWKLDGTGTLFYTLFGPVPLFYKTTSRGIMSTRNYMDLYYREEYKYGLTRNPEFVTLARAIDRGFHPEGFAPFDAAPVTWVGDQKHNWESTGVPSEEDKQNGDIAMKGIEGIELAMKNIMASAKLGYNIIGSDVAGFSGREIPPRLYIRWAQFSAFCGLFLNGGHGERALWKRSSQELEIIRKFSWLHTELIPYMYTYVVKAHNGGIRLQQPIKGKYHYLFGEDFLIAPIFKDQLSNVVTLPKGNWRYFFDDKQVIKGPTILEREYPLSEYPVYIREGAIIPLDIKRGYTGIGDESNEGSLTWLIYPGAENKFTVYHPDKTGSSTVAVTNISGTIEIKLSDISKPSVLCVNLEKEPEGVSFEGSDLKGTNCCRYDLNKRKLIIKIPGIRNGLLKITE